MIETVLRFRLQRTSAFTKDGRPLAERPALIRHLHQLLAQQLAGGVAG